MALPRHEENSIVVESLFRPTSSLTLLKFLYFLAAPCVTVTRCRSDPNMRGDVWAYLNAGIDMFSLACAIWRNRERVRC
jgi:hypothetical protein